ncbi:MAG: hypothetical protein Q8K58_12420 [Acidimicrobiales bacterium]|nr:hypothetical protein [Acidimicrobiales bacterium]
MTQFVDECGLHVKGGDGGAGCVSFRREAPPRWAAPTGATPARAATELLPGLRLPIDLLEATVRLAVPVIDVVPVESRVEQGRARPCACERRRPPPAGGAGSAGCRGPRRGGPPPWRLGPSETAWSARRKATSLVRQEAHRIHVLMIHS